MTERIYEARNRAFSLLEEKGLDSGSVNILLQHITGLSHAKLLANMQSELTKTERRRFWEKVAQLVEGNLSNI